MAIKLPTLRPIRNVLRPHKLKIRPMTDFIPPGSGAKRTQYSGEIHLTGVDYFHLVTDPSIQRSGFVLRVYLVKATRSAIWRFSRHLSGRIL
jgi:hypothetical protein